MRETSSEREFDSRFDAAFQPGFDDPVPGQRAGLDEFDPFGFDEALDRPGEGGDRQPVARSAVRLIDRFLIAIWVLGAAFVVLGIGGVSYGARSYYGTEGGGPDYFSIVAMQFSPWLIVIGLGTFVGSVFLLASRSDRRA